MAAPVEVRRFLHVNYNCNDIERLARFYLEAFGLRIVMRSESASGEPSGDGSPFGLFGPIDARTWFLYDHRGGRRANSLELIQWTSPPTVGSPYPDPWNPGIQALAYSADHLDRVVECAERHGGSLVRRGDDWLLLRDPEGVWVEVPRADGPSEAKYVRVVCSDLDRTVEWWAGLGFAPATLPTPPVSHVWPADGERAVRAEQAMVPTDDATFGVLLTAWTGPFPSAPSYGMFHHHGLYRMATAVDDVGAAFETLRQRGIPRQRYRHFPMTGTKLTDGLDIQFLREPDGILVELVERPRQP